MGERNDDALAIREEPVMTDAAIQRPLTLTITENGAVFLRLPYSRLGEVESVLKENQIRYWSSEHIMSYNGGPETTRVHFGYNKTPAAIQTLLDSIR